MSKIKNLPSKTVLSDDDIFYVADTDVAVAGDRKIKTSDLKDSIKPTNAETKAAYEANVDTNAYTDADKSKLNGIEDGATTDQSANEVDFTSQSGLVSSNVQEAIDEVNNSKEPKITKNTAFNKDFGTIANTIVQGNDERLSTAYKITVKKNPGAGQFASIHDAAIHASTIATTSVPVQINVGPGVYEEDTIVVNENIWVRGERDATIVRPTNPNNDIFVLSSTCGVAQMKVEGAIGANAAAFRRVGGNTDSAIQLIDFGSNTNLVAVDSTAGVPSVLVESCRIDSTSEFQNGFSIVGNGQGTLIIDACTGEISGTGVNCDNLIYGSGSNNQIVLMACNFRVEGLATVQNGLYIYDGISVYCSAVNLIRFENGLHVPNIGLGPILNIANLSLSRPRQKSIMIDSPSATGHIFAVTSIEDTSVNNTNVKLVLTETNQDGVAIITNGDIKQILSSENTLNQSKLSREEATLGLLEGGELFDDPTGLPLDIVVRAGNGFLVGTDNQAKEVSWEDTILSLPADSEQFININQSGIPIYTESAPDDYSKNIPIGRIITSTDRVVGVEDVRMFLKHHGNLMERADREKFGTLVANGCVTSFNAGESSGTDLALNVSPGVVYLGSTRKKPVGGDGLGFFTLIQDAPGSLNPISRPLPGVVSTFSSDKYDDGSYSGVLANVPAGKYVKHVLLLRGDEATEAYTFVYGQELFDDLPAAQAGPLPQLPDAVSNNLSLTITVAHIITQAGGTAPEEIANITPRVGFAAAALTSGSGGGDHGTLSGLSDDDHQQYLPRTGIRPMQGNLDMGNNEIINNTTINGVSITNHGARHAPGSSDPIPTAAPTTNLNGNTGNSVGSANSVSRSDHTHEIDTATVTVGGLMSSADKSKLDGIESGATADQAASEVPYDNTVSSLEATDVKTAIDEVSADVNTNSSNLSTHLSPTGTKHNGNQITYQRADGSKKAISASSDDVESAITDLDDNKLNRDGTQSMTGNLNMNNNEIANASAINGKTFDSVNNDIQSVGSQNLAGTSSKLANADHQHDFFSVVNYTQVENSAVISSSSNTAATVSLTLQVIAPVSGFYHLTWYFEYSNSGTGGDTLSKVLYVENGNEELMKLQHELSDSNGNDFGGGGSDQTIPVSGFKYIELTAGTHTFNLTIGGINNIGYQRRRRLAAWRVR